MAFAYTRVLLIIDHIASMANNHPFRMDSDMPGLAQMFFEHMICKHGVPDNIITHCGMEFASLLWDSVCCLIEINYQLMTTAHSQEDGDTRWLNQMPELYL